MPAGPSTDAGKNFSADALARALSDDCWQVRSAGPGSKGLRLYQWAYLHLDDSAARSATVS
jgi:hypothetical protein